jgi:GTP-binding protein
VILGRPNVGKSTLFNRLIGKQSSLVHDRPGVTRDFLDDVWNIDNYGPTRLIDTAGLEEAGEGELTERMKNRSLTMLERADIILFVLDARSGVIPSDHHYADLMRRAGKPVILVANKCEGEAVKAQIYEAYELGLGEPIPVSAEHNLGIEALEHKAAETLSASDLTIPDTAEDMDGADDGSIRLSIVGRPNAGKSTLFNKILDQDRALTGPEAGVTRDTIEVPYEFDGRKFTLIDTAGLRRKARIDAVEKMSTKQTLQAIRFAQCVILVVDATRPLEKQDLRIADHVVDEGRCLIIAANKWDLVEYDKNWFLQAMRDRLSVALAQDRGLPLIPVQATSGKNINRLMGAVIDTYDKWNTRISTGKLNRWLKDAMTRNPPPAAGNRVQKIRYITQIKNRPPRFAIWCSHPDKLPQSYERYLLNELREDFDLWGVPVKLYKRTSDNPYSD